MDWPDCRGDLVSLLEISGPTEFVERAESYFVRKNLLIL